MSIVDEIGRAISAEVRQLAQMRVRLDGMTWGAAQDPATAKVPATTMFRNEELRKLLRVEASYMTEAELARWAYQHGWRDHGEPLTFCGVSVYVVRHALPPSGWRVINPMVADQPQRSAA